MARITFNRSAVYTSFTVADAPTPEIYKVAEIVRQATQFRPKGFQHMPRYKRGMWDGYIRLGKGGHFPTGLLWHVMQAVNDAGYKEIGWEDVCTYPVIDNAVIIPDSLSGITLRDYQLDAAKALLTRNRGIARMATNSGKTAVIALVAKAVRDKVLILTTKKDLLYQTSDVIAKFIGESVGIIGDGKVSKQRVTVGMIQTLCRRAELLKQYNDIGCVVFDECHHIPSKTAQQVLLGINAPLRFGFSGTPLRGDDLDDMTLVGATGPVCVDISNADLIERGISAVPTVYMYEVCSDVDYEDDKLAYGKAYKRFITSNVDRNQLIADIVLKRRAKSTLILVEQLGHGRELNRVIPHSIFVSGSADIEARDSAKNVLKEARGGVVISTPIFDEGVDVPAVSLLVIAGGGKGMIKLLQRVGRGMRRKEVDNVLHVIDFVDYGNKYLVNQSVERAKIYESEGFKVEIVNRESASTPAGIQQGGKE